MGVVVARPPRLAGDALSLARNASSLARSASRRVGGVAGDSRGKSAPVGGRVAEGPAPGKVGARMEYQGQVFQRTVSPTILCDISWGFGSP